MLQLVEELYRLYIDCLRENLRMNGIHLYGLIEKEFF